MRYSLRAHQHPALSTQTCSPRVTVLIVGAKAISDEQWAVHAGSGDVMALGPIEDVHLALAIVANLIIDKVVVTSDFDGSALLPTPSTGCRSLFLRTGASACRLGTRALGAGRTTPPIGEVQRAIQATTKRRSLDARTSAAGIATP